MLLLLQCSGEETEENLSSRSPMEDRIDYTKGFQSGIVFRDRGEVLITGESWTVAKEINVTQIALLVQEARRLFPNIRKKLKNARSNESSALDLRIFQKQM